MNCRHAIRQTSERLVPTPDAKCKVVGAAFLFVVKSCQAFSACRTGW